MPNRRHAIPDGTTLLAGNWLNHRHALSGKVTLEPDAVEKQIAELIESKLELVCHALDGTMLYRDPGGRTTWELQIRPTEPDGSGPRSLRKTAAMETDAKFGARWKLDELPRLEPEWMTLFAGNGKARLEHARTALKAMGASRPRPAWSAGYYLVEDWSHSVSGHNVQLEWQPDGSAYVSGPIYVVQQLAQALAMEDLV